MILSRSPIDTSTISISTRRDRIAYLVGAHLMEASRIEAPTAVSRLRLHFGPSEHSQKASPRAVLDNTIAWPRPHVTWLSSPGLSSNVQLQEGLMQAQNSLPSCELVRR